jgi:hypothetical protein
MQNFKYFIVFVALLGLVFVLPVHAEQCTDKYSCFLELKCKTIPECVELVAKYMVTIAAPLATIFIIYAGILFATAGGNEKRLETAKATLMWTIIGLAVTIGAWTLAIAFQNFFEGL